jgi:hypothetical protein
VPGASLFVAVFLCGSGGQKKRQPPFSWEDFCLIQAGGKNRMLNLR